MLVPSGGQTLNSSLTYPDWLEEMVEETGNELLYRAYEILDRILPRKERIRIYELVEVFGISELELKKAGFFLGDTYKREKLLKELLSRSNYYRWG